MYILKYNNFFDYSLNENEDHIDYYIECLKWTNRMDCSYPYSLNYFTNKLLNYTLCLYKIDDCVKFFFNSESIIFLNNKDNNNFMFYILNEIDRDNNYWKMDNRLIEFTTEIQESLLSFMILMFRNMHQNIFLNDKFNKNYKVYNKGFIKFEYDMLLYNIFIVSDLIKLSNILMNFIKQNNSYSSSSNDFFDKFDDDLSTKDMFDNHEDINIHTVCRQLFHDISSYDAQILYNSIISK